MTRFGRCVLKESPQGRPRGVQMPALGAWPFGGPVDRVAQSRSLCDPEAPHKELGFLGRREVMCMTQYLIESFGIVVHRGCEWQPGELEKPRMQGAELAEAPPP
jgi:hypothetical protein